MQNRKENDKKLYEIEDNEQLNQDCENTRKYTNNIGLEYIRKDAIKQYEELQKEFLHNNMWLGINEILVVNKVFKFLKEKA